MRRQTTPPSIQPAQSLRHALSVVCGAALLLLAPFAFAQDGPFKFRIVNTPLTLEAGQPGKIQVEMTAAPGTYLYADQLSFAVKAPSGITVKPAVMPAAHEKFDPATEETKTVYEGKGLVSIPLAVAATAPEKGSLAITVEFQGCEATRCFMPDTLRLTLPFTVKGGSAAAEATGPVTAEATPAPAEPATAQAQPAASAEQAGTTAANAAETPKKEDYGSLLAFLALFFAGVITSFTPCVYPVIPVTIAIFGAKKAKSKFQGFLLSLCYVQGICLIYAILGVAAASSGAVFGQYMSNPWVIGSIAGFFVLLGFYMAGVFQFNLPSSWQTKASQMGGKGFVGAFVMGMVSGVVAAPCTGPALAGVLAWVATTGQAIMGFFLLYVYAMGIGVLFLALGTFSTLIGKLPKSGDWMEVVKGIFAVTMFAVALFYLKDLLPFLQAPALSKLTLFCTGIAFLISGFVSKGLKVDLHQSKFGGKIRKILTIAILTVGAHLLVVGFTRFDGKLPWRHDLAPALAEGAASGKPVVVDFSASWCAACKELEKYTFSDPAVADEMKRFILVKVDMTEKTPENEALKAKYGIVGLPQVVFYDGQGALMAKPRVGEYISAGEFLEALRQVR